MDKNKWIEEKIEKFNRDFVFEFDEAEMDMWKATSETGGTPNNVRIFLYLALKEAWDKAFGYGFEDGIKEGIEMTAE